MIPNHMDKQYTGCLLITAMLNLVFSMMLIPVTGIYGAVAGTIISELTCAIIQVIICRSIITLKKIIKISIPYAVSGFLMVNAP